MEKDLAVKATKMAMYLLPVEVRHLVKEKCSIKVSTLRDWELANHWTGTKRSDLAGVFGWNRGHPAIGINYKALDTVDEAIKTTLHEVGHFFLRYQRLPYGERAANNVVKEWLL